MLVLKSESAMQPYVEMISKFFLKWTSTETRYSEDFTVAFLRNLCEMHKFGVENQLKGHCEAVRTAFIRVDKHFREGEILQATEPNQAKAIALADIAANLAKKYAISLTSS